MENENIIDLGEWKCPKSWDELTLKQFEAIEEYYSDKDSDFDVREVLNIFTDKSIDEINQLPMEFANKLLDELLWLREQPKFGEPKNYIMVDGEKYQVNVQEKLKTGEFIATSTVLKDNAHNYAAILAILCRKEGELFDAKFENEVLPSRIEMWENLGVTKVMPIITFFLQLWTVLELPLRLSMEVQEGINHIRKDIETSAKNGEISKRYMRSVMRKLKKLEKSIKST